MKLDLTAGGYLVHDNKVLLIHHKKLQMWLPVGGHIEENETPDDALIREFKEEVNLKVELLNVDKSKIEPPVKRRLALPFYVDVHSVGDHDHCGFSYVCKTDDISKLEFNKDELTDAKWFGREDLNELPFNIQKQCITAMDLFAALTRS